MNEHICNAVISSVSIRLDRECFLSVWLDLKYDKSTGQGFGGWVLGGVPGTKAGDHGNQKNIAGEYIVQCMLVAGVDNMKDIAGRAIRVKYKGNGFDRKIIAIGHFIDDLWFEPREMLARLTEGTP